MMSVGSERPPTQIPHRVGLQCSDPGFGTVHRGGVHFNFEQPNIEVLCLSVHFFGDL